MLFSRKRTLCVSSLVRFFSNTAIPAASREGYFVCILTCDIFILTCHTNCFLDLDVNGTCFIYCTPTSFPLFLSDTFLPDPFFIQVLFLPSLFFYQPLLARPFYFKLLFCRKRAFIVSSLCDICIAMLPFIQDSCSFDSNSLIILSSLG